MHSIYSTVLRLLLVATATTFGKSLSTHRPHVMQIGVHIIYNHEVQETFIKTNRDPNYYFTVLLHAVETRLATFPYPYIELTLVGTSAINESNAIEDLDMEKKEIYERYKRYYTRHRHDLDCPDVAFYVTRNYFMEVVEDEATTKIGGMCGNASMGMFYDDGLSFLGIHTLSREMAFLKLYDNCWSDKPTPILRNNWTLPSKYLEDYLINGRVDLCTAHRFYLELRSCKNYSSYRKSHTCRVSCCEQDTNDPVDYVMEPDGRACGYFRGNKMCIHGECVTFSSS